MELRDYQVEAIDGARQRIRDGARRILMVAPTGSGKTVIASDIIRSAGARGSRCLFLAHRRELIGQTSKKLVRFGVPHGIVMAGERPAPQESVQVASIQTLIQRRHAVPDCDIVIVDEAHHAAADSYVQVMQWYPTAKVLGLTATPWRADGKGLADLFDSHVLVKSPRELRDAGWLVPCGAWEYRAVDTAGLKTRGGDFVVDKEMENRATDALIMGSVVEEWLQHANDCLTVVFAVTVLHSQALTARFCQAGVLAEHVDAKTPKDQRDAIFERIRTGQTRVLCNVGIATEGLDIPELECAVLCRPTKSLGLALQMIGRILRPSAETGKTSARIHDHARVLQMHGHPYDDRDYSPSLTSQEVDKKTEEKESERRGPRNCPQCGCVLVLDAGGRCSECKAEFLPTELPNAERVQVAEGGRRRSMGRTWTPDQRRAEWQFKTLAEKIQVLVRMIQKHGPRRAPRVYRWISGDSEWPSNEIREAAQSILDPAATSREG